MGDLHGQETGLKRDFDSSTKKWTVGSGPTVPEVLEEARRNGVQTKKNRNKSSILTIMLHVLTYVVSNKLFWN